MEKHDSLDDWARAAVRAMLRRQFAAAGLELKKYGLRPMAAGARLARWR